MLKCGDVCPQATWQSSLDRARGLNHTRSQPLYSNIVAQNTHFQSQTSANPAHLGSGWSGQQQQQQPGSIMHSNTGLPSVSCIYSITQYPFMQGFLKKTPKNPVTSLVFMQFQAPYS